MRNKVDERHQGWEQIWRGGYIPPRYAGTAKPSPAVVEWAKTLNKGEHILDVGCGVGRHAVYLGSNGYRVSGMDISPTGIKLTQEICAVQHIDFDGRVSDMTALSWDDRTFDGALSIAVIHHHRRADMVKTLAEIKRVLKPGGFFLTDFPCTDTLTYQQLRQQVAAGELVEVEPNTFVDERERSEDEDGFLPHHFSDKADLRDLLRPFEIIRLRADLRETTLENGQAGKVGKWVAWVRRPIA